VEACLIYSEKSNTRVEGPFSVGICPVERNSKTDWQKVWEAAKAGDFDSIPYDIRTKHIKSLLTIRSEFSVALTADDVRGIWIWGPPETGKTHIARDLYPGSLYVKA